MQSMSIAGVHIGSAAVACPIPLRLSFIVLTVFCVKME